MQERLAIAEGLLRAKEQEGARLLQQAHAVDEERLHELEEELTRAHARAKSALDALAAQTHEATAANAALEARTADAEAEAKHWADKAAASDAALADTSARLVEADKLGRSLRAVLREKEDAAAALESALALKQQEAALAAGELQRRALQFEEDTAEATARIRALEAAAVKMRAQIAEADASGTLKDELLAAALSKQAATGDESRQMRALVDSRHHEVATLTAELTEARTQLAALQVERAGRDEQDRALKAAHKQATEALAAAQEGARRLEEEVELVRVELKGTTTELVTFKASLDQAEALLGTQEAEGRDLRAQGAALQGTVAALTGENEQLRQALDDVTGKVHNYTHTRTSLHACVPRHLSSTDRTTP